MPVRANTIARPERDGASYCGRRRRKINPRRPERLSVKRLTLVAAIVLATIAPVRADFATGWEAYRDGDYAIALEAWLPLAERGDIDAMYDVAALYESGMLGEPDMASALIWFRRAAERRLAAAQYHLAWLYDMGFGVDPNSERSLEWYRRAAERGHTKAQFNLGVAYERGAAIAPDVGQAARWYREAANTGLPPAQYNLGRLYYHGAGVPKDMALAVQWYGRAADAGYAPAQTNLGYMYENGIHLPRDSERAVALYRRAADQGFAAAQTNLGIMLSFGLGVQRDYAEATRWYRAAAVQGDIDAQTNLALMFANGLGIDRDLVEAYAWLTLAAAGESQAAGTAIEYRTRLGERMSDAETAAGEARVTALGAELTTTAAVERRAAPRETTGFGRLDLTIQRRLAALGHYQGAVDGIVGPMTRAAIRAFQKGAGLAVDGHATVELLARLDDTLLERRAAIAQDAVQDATE